MNCRLYREGRWLACRRCHQLVKLTEAQAPDPARVHLSCTARGGLGDWLAVLFSQIGISHERTRRWMVYLRLVQPGQSCGCGECIGGRYR